MAHLGDPYTTPWDHGGGRTEPPPQPPHLHPPPFLLLIGGGLGAATIIAAAKLHTLVQVHDRPEGFFDLEIFELDISTRRTARGLLTCRRGCCDKICPLPQELVAAFFSLSRSLSLLWEGSFLRAFKQSRCPPVSKDLWEGGEGRKTQLKVTERIHCCGSKATNQCFALKQPQKRPVCCSEHFLSHS